MPGLSPPMPSTRGQRVRVGKAEEPGLGPRSPSCSLPPAVPAPALASSSLLPHLKEQPPSRATSFLLILAPGQMDPRLGTRKEGGGVSGVRTPGINTCHSAHLLMPVPSSQQPVPALVASPSLSASWELSEAARGCQPTVWTRHFAVFSNSLEERGTCSTWPWLKFSREPDSKGLLGNFVKETET